MIDREQLAGALERLHPRDREVLDLSLRRRVPDEDLATVFGTDASDVARMRAAAVERLSGELDVQRGEDLGHMLKQLLEPSTWSLLRPPAEAEPVETGEHRPVGAAGGEPVDTARPQPAPLHEPSPQSAEPPPARRTERVDDESEHEPVLGMLAGRPRDGRDEAGRSNGRKLGTAALLACAVLVPAGMIAALTSGSADEAKPDASSATRPFKPERLAVGDPFPSDPTSVNKFPIAVVRKRTALLERPGGGVKARIRAKTEWDSPRVLSVVRQEGDWLAVLAAELENGEVGWIREDRVSRLDTVAWSLHADLSSRTLEVERGGKVMRKFKIGVGRKNHATPTGRYAVTDKLKVGAPDSPYGCCVLALTGHQTKLPAGWPGGDRLALHATRDRSGLGRAVSLGCMRADPADARWMMKRVPLGSPVFVEQ